MVRMVTRRIVRRWRTCIPQVFIIIFWYHHIHFLLILSLSGLFGAHLYHGLFLEMQSGIPRVKIYSLVLFCIITFVWKLSCMLLFILWYILIFHSPSLASPRSRKFPYCILLICRTRTPAQQISSRLKGILCNGRQRWLISPGPPLHLPLGADERLWGHLRKPCQGVKLPNSLVGTEFLCSSFVFMSTPRSIWKHLCCVEQGGLIFALHRTRGICPNRLLSSW